MSPRLSDETQEELRRILEREHQAEQRIAGLVDAFWEKRCGILIDGVADIRSKAVAIVDRRTDDYASDDYGRGLAEGWAEALDTIEEYLRIVSKASVL